MSSDNQEYVAYNDEDVLVEIYSCGDLWIRNKDSLIGFNWLPVLI